MYMHHSNKQLSITALGFTSEIETTSHRAFSFEYKFIRMQNKMQFPSNVTNIF